MELNPVFVELVVYAIVVIGTIAVARLLFRPRQKTGLAPEPAAEPVINAPVPPAPPSATDPAPAPFSAPMEPDAASVESAPSVAPQPYAPAVEQADTSVPPVTGSVGDEVREEEPPQPPEIGTQTDELEAFVDESIRVAIAHNYRPTVFMWMRQEHGTQDAISRLVRFGDDQSGFRRLNELGLQDWSIEAAILKFPGLFDQHDRAFAEYRLAQARRQHAPNRGGNGSPAADPAES